MPIDHQKKEEELRELKAVIDDLSRQVATAGRIRECSYAKGILLTLRRVDLIDEAEFEMWLKQINTADEKARQAADQAERLLGLYREILGTLRYQANIEEAKQVHSEAKGYCRALHDNGAIDRKQWQQLLTEAAAVLRTYGH